MTEELLEVTFPGPGCSEEAIAAAERVKVGEHAAYFPRLEIGLVRGDQHIPRAIAEQLIATGVVKRTNPPRQPKAQPPISAPAPAPQE